MNNSRFYLAVAGGITAFFLLTGSGVCLEVTVDDGGPGFTKGGSGWAGYLARKQTSQEGDCLRNGIWFNALSSCEYRPVLPDSGEYEVYVWWPDRYGIVLNVPYIVHYSGGSEKVLVNQGSGYMPVTWKLIGKWTFDKGSTGYVEVQNRSTSEGWVYVYADAIKFVYVGAATLNNPPTAIIDYVTPNSAKQGQAVSFKGSGDDTDGVITGYEWRSSIDGVISTSSLFTKSDLSVGAHTIYLKVMDDDNAWSSEVSQSLTITSSGQPQQPISKVPSLMRFQGRLTDSSGNPLNGLYSVIFRIYDSEIGGNLKWNETQTGIVVSEGVFSALLGKAVPLNLNFDRDYWLSTEIETNGEMSPRQRIASVGYAFRAETVNKGAIVYSGHGDISDGFFENVYIHLDGEPRSVKLYFWGEVSAGYPEDVAVSIDGVDKTQSLLQMANGNWKRTETAFGNGLSTHPLVAGANGVTGTGELDITSFIAWPQREHKITFSQSASNKASIRYDVYIKY
jgi:hypothetical protein